MIVSPPRGATWASLGEVGSLRMIVGPPRGGMSEYNDPMGDYIGPMGASIDPLGD